MYDLWNSYLKNISWVRLRRNTTFQKKNYSNFSVKLKFIILTIVSNKNVVTHTVTKSIKPKILGWSCKIFIFVNKK